ncbi:MAG: hypothetical protein LBF78_13080 [Treponema sp.]|jgi:hypothetical protein|nr:hypothetical protein [Treponema sp.]
MAVGCAGLTLAPIFHLIFSISTIPGLDKRLLEAVFYLQAAVFGKDYPAPLYPAAMPCHLPSVTLSIDAPRIAEAVRKILGGRGWEERG